MLETRITCESKSIMSAEPVLASEGDILYPAVSLIIQAPDSQERFEVIITVEELAEMTHKAIYYGGGVRSLLSSPKLPLGG